MNQKIEKIEYSDVPCENENCNYLNPEIGLMCDNCGKFLFSFNRNLSLLFILSLLVSIILFRKTGFIWPMYLLIMMGIIHLYSIVFSRGKSLKSATILFCFVSIIWSLSNINFFSFFPKFLITLINNFYPLNTNNLETFYYSGTIFLWLFLSIMAINLGKSKAMPGVKIGSSFFLGTGVFIMGLWAVWAILIKEINYREIVYHIAIMMALLVPLLLLVLLLHRRVPEGTKSQKVAIWFLVIAIYLFSTHLLTNLVEIGLGKILPRLLNIKELGPIDLPWLTTLLNWRIPIYTSFIAFALISLISASISQMIQEFKSNIPIAIIEQRKKSIKAKSETKGLYRFSSIVMGMTIDIIALIIIVGQALSNFTLIFINNLLDSLKNVINYLKDLIRLLVIPVFSFSILALLIIMFLQHTLIFYNGNSISSLQLWGEAIILILAVLLLCSASFGFAPSTQTRLIFSGTEAVSFLVGIIYVIISLASISMPLVWYGFKKAGIYVPYLTPSSFFKTNIIAIISILLLLIMFTFIGNLLRNKRIKNFELSKLANVFIVISIIFWIGYTKLDRKNKGIWDKI